MGGDESVWLRCECLFEACEQCMCMRMCMYVCVAEGRCERCSRGKEGKKWNEEKAAM